MTDFSADLAANENSIRNLMRAFMASVTLVGGGVGGWAGMTKIDSAVVASGAFAVQSNAQTIQHPEGGVVGAILVHDGELVKEGQVLIRLDAAKVASDTSIVERKLIDLVAERARLEAEQQDSAVIAFPTPPVARPRRWRRCERVSGRSSLFWTTSARQGRASCRSCPNAIRRSKARSAGSPSSSRPCRARWSRPPASLPTRRSSTPRASCAARSCARPSARSAACKGKSAKHKPRSTSARSQLRETEYKIAETKKSGQSDILTQLQSVVEKIAQAEQERAASSDRFQRLEIKAPRTGYVNELAVHTVGGVMSPGQTVMSIIPNNDRLWSRQRYLPARSTKFIRASARPCG